MAKMTPNTPIPTPQTRYGMLFTPSGRSPVVLQRPRYGKILLSMRLPGFIGRMLQRIPIEKIDSTASFRVIVSIEPCKSGKSSLMPPR